MKKVAIIIPVFNHADELQKCLASLRAQTFQDFEIVVVDDGSVTPIVCQDVRVIRQENQGAPAARNRGCIVTSSEYLLFSDADIVWEPTALQKMVETLEAHPEVDFTYASFYFGFKKFVCGEFSKEKLKKNNFIHTSALIRRSKFGGFDESLKKFQDWDLWLTMVEHGSRGLWIDEVLFTITPRASGMSQWLPSFLYAIPWLPLVKKYRAAEKIIRDKHGI